MEDWHLRQTPSFTIVKTKIPPKFVPMTDMHLFIVTWQLYWCVKPWPWSTDDLDFNNFMVDEF